MNSYEMLKLICLTDELEDNFYRLFPVPFYHHRCCQLLFSLNTSSLPEHLIRPDLPMAEHLSTDGLQLGDVAIEGVTTHLLKSSKHFLPHMVFNLLQEECVVTKGLFLLSLPFRHNSDIHLCGDADNRRKGRH